MKYPSVQKKILVAIRCIKLFLFFLQHEKFVVKSNLNNFKSYLTRLSTYKSPSNGRLLRWSLWFKKFDIIFEHIKGTKNIIANFLTREYIIFMNRSNEWIVQSTIPYLTRVDSRNKLEYYIHFKRGSFSSLHN